MRPVLTVVIFVLCGAVTPKLYAQGECKVVFDATDKVADTPHHIYSVRTGPGKETTQQKNELIYAGGVIYVQVRGQWRKSPLTPTQQREQQQENRKNAKNISCHHLRDETVNGEPAAVYSAHAETEDTKSDAVVWISKSSGLLLRQDENLDSDGDKFQVSARYEYGNVTPPAAVAP